MDVSEAKVASLRTVGQLGVVDTQQLQNCRLEIVDVNLALDDSKSQFIGLAQSKPEFTPPPASHIVNASM